MAFYPFVGYGVFWIALIVSVIMYLVTRKWYPIAYLITVALYTFTTAFIIDVFNLDKNGVILVLAFSAIVMLGLGFFITKKQSSR